MRPRRSGQVPIAARGPSCASHYWYLTLFLDPAPFRGLGEKNLLQTRRSENAVTENAGINRKDRVAAGKRRKRRRWLSWKKKLLFAGVATGLFFLALEGVLSLVGVQPVVETGDPFVGFSRQVPLMEMRRNDAGDQILETAPRKLVWFNHQQFAAEKPANTKRIVCVGGSTTFGRPYADSTSYSGWLRELLPATDSSTRWEVINAGGVSYASYRVAAVMEELAQYDPDLFIVYSVHNEFLERRTYQDLFETSALARDLSAAVQKTRTGSLIRKLLRDPKADATDAAEMLPAEVDEMLNHSVGPLDYHADSKWTEKVLMHYELNLERMVSIARNADARIVFVTPASNLRDCSPFKSESSTEVSAEDSANILRLIDQAMAHFLDQDYDAVLKASRSALAIDQDYADAHYLAGRALFHLGRFDQAELEFERAIDVDVCPLRAVSPITDIIRRVAKRKQVPVVEFDNLLRDECRREFGHACLGREYFLDHVHPTIDVHRRLAIWILGELQRSGLVGGSMPAETEMALIRDKVEGSVDREATTVAFRNLAKVLHWAGKFEEAIPRAQDALDLNLADLESRFVLADCLFNMRREEEAFEQYEHLSRIGDFPRAYLPYGEMLADRNRLVEAERYLTQAVLTCDEWNLARAHYSLGSVHYMLGEFELAISSLQQSDRLYPNEPGTLRLLAESQISGGDSAEGIVTLRQVIALDPSDSDSHYRLGMMYLADGNLVDAKRHLETATSLNPSDDRAQQSLEAIEQIEP